MIIQALIIGFYSLLPMECTIIESYKLPSREYTVQSKKKKRRK